MAPKTEAAPFDVKVARFTESRSVSVQLDPSKVTVADALAAADMKPEDDETILVNGQASDFDTPLQQGDIVTLANKPMGG